MSRLKIVAERSVPYIRGVVEKWGEVTYLPSSDFTPQSIRGADWLIVRSTTRCDRALLEGSSVQLITSATIGFDHIDTAFCQEAGIIWHNAPGCNAEAVAQYFAATIALLAVERGFDPRGKVLGIVGVGNVGKLVARNAQALGLRLLLNDPPRARAEGSDGFVSLEQIAEEADIIAFHVPLIKTGEDKTVHLLDEQFVSKLRRQPILINACRGAVTSTQALLKGLKSGKISATVMDCWEGEPSISQELLQMSWLATPHIAGFSAQGKANGARVSIQHGMAHFGLQLTDSHLLYPEPLAHPQLHLTSQAQLYEAILQTFDIRRVDQSLRANVTHFEELRRQYHYPYEPSQYQLLKSEIVADEKAAKEIGFQIINA